MNIDNIWNALEYEINQLVDFEQKRIRGSKTSINVEKSISTILSLCDEILLLFPEKSIEKYVKFIRSACYLRTKHYTQAVNELRELGYDELWISKQDDDLKNEMFHQLVQDKIYESEENRLLLDRCKEIHTIVLDILQQLIIQNNEEDLLISHYTTRDVAEKLLFEPQSPFRMCSISTVNDPFEGKLLYDHLKCPSWNKEDNEKNEYQCFVGSFTLDSDSLNHFRLYGKDNEKEATGVSLSIKPDKFISRAKSQLCIKRKFDFDDEYYSLPLYRCLYIHSSNNEKKVSCPFVDDLSEIETSFRELESKTSSLLKDLSEKENENLLEVISKILMPLSYLIKHAAFKEEQECRLFSIQKLGGNEQIKFCSSSRRMFIEPPFPPTKDLDTICFAPKTTGYHLFKDRLAMHSINAKCKKSKLKFENI